MINVGLTKQLNVHANNDLIDMLPIKIFEFGLILTLNLFFYDLICLILYLTRCSRIYITMSNYLCGLAILTVFLNVYKNKSSRNTCVINSTSDETRHNFGARYRSSMQR